MIGKSNWFKRRKYTGWGISPAKWQGWLYIGVIVLVFIVIQSLPLGNNLYNLIATIVFALLVIADCLDIMFRLPKDEREILHEAKSERNALFAMITILIVGIFYETIIGVVNERIEIDPVIIAALLGAVIVKALSNYYFDKKN